MQRSTRLLRGEGGGDEDDGLHEGAEGGAEHGVESPAADRRGTAVALLYTALPLRGTDRREQSVQRGAAVQVMARAVDEQHAGDGGVLGEVSK